ncbi:nuclear transport factor 2 family protein [Candidatus Rariloculus sp.]|uniref:nuclear transport factor 2 family protein n=1 Tax=Candidatus Rariloculus sp. TaxID=3101265 RepID=UPI003D09F251
MSRIFILMAALGLAGFASAQVAVEAHPDQHAMLESDDAELAAAKQLVFDFWRYVLVARDMDRARQYMAETYIQHNPNIPTGRAPFIAFFGQMEQRPVQDTIDGLVAIVGEGDLVSMSFVRECADPRNEGGMYTTTWFDMFRVEDGMIAEHWDYGTVTGEDNPSDCL